MMAVRLEALQVRLANAMDTPHYKMVTIAGYIVSTRLTTFSFGSFSGEAFQTGPAEPTRHYRQFIINSNCDRITLNG